MSSSQIATPAEPHTSGVGERLKGKYMAFKLGAEEYALPILTVREIIGLMDITRIPQTMAFVRGVINLRGRVIPVIDLRLKFGMAATEATDQTVIIVVQHPFRGRVLTMGLLVDEVVEVLDIPAARIEPRPEFGSIQLDVDFILGVGKSDDRVIFLLDGAKVLSADDQQQLADVEGSGGGVSG